MLAADAPRKERARLISQPGPYLCRQRPTLPHTFACSTIGPAGLNFRVRDGNGCFPCGKITGFFDADRLSPASRSPSVLPRRTCSVNLEALGRRQSLLPKSPTPSARDSLGQSQRTSPLLGPKAPYLQIAGLFAPAEACPEQVRGVRHPIARAGDLSQLNSIRIFLQARYIKAGAPSSSAD